MRVSLTTSAPADRTGRPDAAFLPGQPGGHPSPVEKDRNRISEPEGGVDKRKKNVRGECWRSSAPFRAASALCDFNRAENTKAAEYPRLFDVRNFGAGEAIRTLDPNLGKVVLYP